MRAGWTFTVALGLMVCALAQGCSPPRRATTVTIGAEDAGGRVALDEGQVLEVTLAANPTTGYTWMVREIDESILRPVGEPAFTPQSRLLGASGVQVLRFEALAPGEMTLTLVYLRPWESVQPLETYSVEVVVR